MCHRRGELYMAHTFTPHLGKRYLDTAFLANHATVFQAFILSAQALVILYRTENLPAEQAVPLGLERAVIDGFRFLHFTVRPGTYFFRRSETDLDRVEFFFLGNLFE